MALRMTRGSRAAGLVSGTLCIAVLAGCGTEEPNSKPRPAVAVEISGVIQKDRVTISPDSLGAGPILITISNQTGEAHTVTLLEGERARERVGPINPLDTATIQASVERGSYVVRAGSLDEEIQPAILDVGDKREDSNDQLLLP